ncbi:hypothetical protein ACQE3E_08210 [Methylomonas sp. MED-D]|uniref:hypothetical protein n=1 Tax=Methylomonas sp. MED-D TaxID=3418768 RepID=UPI003CFBFB34
MNAYLILDLSINNFESFREYIEKIPLFIKKHGAGESLFLPKDFFELPSRKKSAKITRPLMPAAPRFVRVTSFRPSKGSKHRLSHDLTPFRDALQVFSASLRKPARRYGYRGLKIFTSLALRFQDFQR